MEKTTKTFNTWSSKLIKYLKSHSSEIQGVEKYINQVRLNQDLVDNLDFQKLENKSDQQFSLGLYYLLGFLVNPKEFSVYSNLDDQLNGEYEFYLEAEDSSFRLYGPGIDQEDFENYEKGVPGYEDLPPVKNFEEDKEYYLTSEVRDWAIRSFREADATDAYLEIYYELEEYSDDDYDWDDEEFDAEESINTEKKATGEKMAVEGRVRTSKEIWNEVWAESKDRRISMAKSGLKEGVPRLTRRVPNSEVWGEVEEFEGKYYVGFNLHMANSIPGLLELYESHSEPATLFNSIRELVNYYESLGLGLKFYVSNYGITMVKEGGISATESVKSSKKSKSATESLDPIEKELLESIKNNRTNIL